MTKAEGLRHWSELPENQPILSHFRPIPYKSEGSSYGACGVRIDGSPEFIDAVLSRLKDLIDAENQVTRLELARNPVKPVMGKAFHKAVANAEVCYIRCHLRGQEGAIAASFFDRHLAGATERYAVAQGIKE